MSTAPGEVAKGAEGTEKEESQEGTEGGGKQFRRTRRNAVGQ